MQMDGREISYVWYSAYGQARVEADSALVLVKKRCPPEPEPGKSSRLARFIYICS
jgi:hypothetical protein